jgi:kynurenine formamidase
MRIRSFIIAYALVLVILLFADRRPGSTQQDRYSHVVDLTDGRDATPPHAIATNNMATESKTHIIAPGALIPGTWTAGQIPPGRLVAPLVVMDLNPTISGSSPKGNSPISLDDIAAWESRHGMIPQGAVVAIRRVAAAPDPKTNDPKTSGSGTNDPSIADVPTTPFPVARDAAIFLIEARSAIGFAVETPVNLSSDRTLAQQLALHGSYVVEGAARFTSLPATGSLIIVAPAKNKKSGDVRVLAMVK